MVHCEQYEIELFFRSHGYSQNRTGRIIPSPLINFSTFCAISCFSEELELEDTEARYL